MLELSVLYLSVLSVLFVLVFLSVLMTMKNMMTMMTITTMMTLSNMMTISTMMTNLLVQNQHVNDIIILFLYLFSDIALITSNH